jgi:hypothetical protein
VALRDFLRSLEALIRFGETLSRSSAGVGDIHIPFSCLCCLFCSVIVQSKATEQEQSGE